MIEVLHYVNSLGEDVFGDWIIGIQDLKTQMRVAARIERLQAENFGDCKSVGEGVSELRLDFGPGYRVYFGQVGKKIVLLLCAGTKRTQSADIKRAIAYFKDHKSRMPTQ